MFEGIDIIEDPDFYFWRYRWIQDGEVHGRAKAYRHGEGWHTCL